MHSYWLQATETEIKPLQGNSFDLKSNLKPNDVSVKLNKYYDAFLYFVFI